ncbi:MAG: hypothetical protein ACI4WY_09230 [Anaerovoracaceae bacterium]
MKNKKNYFCLLLIFIFVFVSASSSFAYTKTMNNGVGSVNEKLDALDTAIIAELCTICAESPIISENKDGIECFYKLDNGNSGYIVEKKFENGEKHYFFKEGNLENEVIYKADGTLLLDGNEVTVTLNRDTVPISFTGFTEQPSIQPKGKHYNIVTYEDSAPEGTVASDYSVFVADDVIDVDFNKTAISLTVGALVTILTGGIVQLANIGVVNGILASIGTGAVATIATSLQTNHPYSVGSKIDRRRFQHSNGYQISHSSIGEARFVYKERLKYYARNSSGGYTLFETSYKYRLTRIMT